jgi:DNA-binding MarR family transcriptional regulator
MASKLTPTDYRALARFRRSLRVFLQFSESAARQAGITPAQHQLLLAIKGWDGTGSPAISDMAEALGLQHHSAVELMSRAEEAGLLRRAAPPDCRPR